MGTSPTMPLSLTRHAGARDKPTPLRHTYSFNRCLVVVGVEFCYQTTLREEEIRWPTSYFQLLSIFFSSLLKLDTYETHAYEVIVEEPEIKSVIKDELFQELEDIIKKIGNGGGVDPRAYPG
jgi:hypothetical protein